jgi:hypothetical protein
MANLDLYLEAERRGILPPDKAGILNEARARGLVPATPAAPGMPQDEMPAPRMSTGQQVLEFVRPTISAVGTTLGGIAGTAAGTPLGPVGMATGGVGGAGLGYAMTEEGLRLVEEALGYRQPVTDPRQLAEQATRNVLEGAAFEAGGRAIVGPVLEAAGRGGSQLIGGIADLRQIPQQKAAAAAREAIVGRVAPGAAGQAQMAAEVAAARQALQAQPDLLPGQALAAAGQVRPTAQALLQRTGAQAPERTMNMLNAQDTVRLNQLAAIAGGTDQTAARAAREEARDILNKLTTPQREIERWVRGRTTQEMIDLGLQGRNGRAKKRRKAFKTCGALLRQANAPVVLRSRLCRVSLACQRKLLILMTLQKPQINELRTRRQHHLILVMKLGLLTPRLKV